MLALSVNSYFEIPYSRLNKSNINIKNMKREIELNRAFMLRELSCKQSKPKLTSIEDHYYHKSVRHFHWPYSE